MTIRVVCWNIAGNAKPWRQLLEMDADVALLQEARDPGRLPDDLQSRVGIGPEAHWNSQVCFRRKPFKRLYDRWPMVARLSDRVEVDWFKQVAPVSQAAEDEFAVSGIGTIAAARVRPVQPETAPQFVVVSMYARWIKPHPSTRSKWKVGYPDGSAHRIISDLSAFIGAKDPSSHRILAAGDLNMQGSGETAVRERSVWNRYKALGLEYLGPHVPNGRPTPDDNRRVVTYYTVAQKIPEKATKQLDHVFASRGFHESVQVRALNSIENWGASDHCRLLMEVGSG